jgi:hypothetical protein
MSSPEHSQLPVIGKDILWDELGIHNKSGYLRATHFAQFASIEGDKVKAIFPAMPYGDLTVECLELKSSFTLYITHRLDFLHLCHAYSLCQNPGERKILLQERAERFKSLWGRDDFLKLYSRAWKTRATEVIVERFSAPQRGIRKWVRKLSGAALPSLIVRVCPKGQLERIVFDDWKGLDEEQWYAVGEPLIELKPQI